MNKASNMQSSPVPIFVHRRSISQPNLKSIPEQIADWHDRNLSNASSKYSRLSTDSDITIRDSLFSLDLRRLSNDTAASTVSYVSAKSPLRVHFKDEDAVKTRHSTAADFQSSTDNDDEGEDTDETASLVSSVAEFSRDSSLTSHFSDSDSEPEDNRRSVSTWRWSRANRDTARSNTKTKSRSLHRLRRRHHLSAPVSPRSHSPATNASPSSATSKTNLKTPRPPAAQLARYSDNPRLHSQTIFDKDGNADPVAELLASLTSRVSSSIMEWKLQHAWKDADRDGLLGDVAESARGRRRQRGGEEVPLGNGQDGKDPESCLAFKYERWRAQEEPEMGVMI